jgi:phosphate transport system permease protein
MSIMIAETRENDIVYAHVRRAHARRFAFSDRSFSFGTRLSALVVLLVLGGIAVSLIVGSLPALRTFGLSFFTTQSWNPVTEKFGAIAPIYGTLVTSFIAILFAVPLGIGIAIFLTELCPERLRRPVGTAIELLAGIPSIIYGIWGLFVFAPFMQTYVQPPVIRAFKAIPGLSSLFAGPPYGIGTLTAGIILAIMVLPFVSAISRDVFGTVPPVLKEAAYGIGCTRWEVVRRVVIPYTRVGIIGGVMLGLGRALGETMAVTFVIGNAHKVAVSFFAPGTTISATIANEFTEAVGDVYSSALIALGLILFIFTFAVLAFARYLLLVLQRKQGS